jgi:GNAT superfamily N-acetyltransferase
MFAFSQIDPETTGSVSEMPVPAMDYLTEGVKAAFGGTLGRIYDYRAGLEEEADMDSPTLSVEEANAQYPIAAGWKEPVRESYANFLNSREQKQQAQAFYLNSKQNVAVQGLGFASSMISGMLNPVDLALMFVPVVGKAPVVGPIEESLLYKGALGRGARFSEAIHKGIVTDYRLEQIFGKYAGIADSTVQGAAFGVMVEPINRHISEFFKEDAGNPLLNIGEMALGAAGMHALFRGLGHAWARLSDDAKLKMMTKGVDDFVKGKDIEVETLAKTDKRWAEEQIRLKEELASLKEIKEQEEANPHHVQIAKDLGVRYDGVQAWIPGQYMAVYTKMDKGNPYTIYMPVDATRAQVKARFKEKIEANKPEPTFEEKVKQIFKSRLDAFRAEMIKPGEKPVIPETGGSPEQHMYSSVLDEIRQKNLRTKEQIQLNFPLAKLSREEAGVLRRSAWNDAEVSSQHDANLKDVIDKANQYLKDNPPGKGVKATNRRKAEQDMPTPPGLKVEEMQHEVLKPEDTTIAVIEKKAADVANKVIQEIEYRFISSRSWMEFHPDVQQALVDAFTVLLEDYPALLEANWQLDLREIGFAIAQVWPMDNKLEFNKQYFLKDNYKKLINVIEGQVNKPVGEKKLAGYGLHSTMYHEMGHVIANMVYKHAALFQDGLFNDPRIKAGYEYVKKNPPTQKELSEYSQHLNTAGDIRSVYAEPFAEAFTQAYSGIGIPNEWQKGFNKAIGLKELTVDEQLAKIGLVRQRGPLGKKGYFTTQDKNFTGLSVQVTKEGIHLNNIQVPEDLRGKGIGSKKIQELKILAKSMDLPLTLTAEALSKDIPANQARLEAYYQRLGFERIKDNEFGYNLPKEGWKALDKAWEQYVLKSDLSPESFKGLVGDIVELVRQGKAPDELGHAAAIFSKNLKDGDITPRQAVEKFRKELNKHLYENTKPKEKAKDKEKAPEKNKGETMEEVIKKLKEAGEKALEDLKKKANELKPRPDIIKSATDCLTQVL